MTLSAAASEVKQWRAEDATDAFWTLDPLTPVSPSDLWYTDLEGHFPDHSYDFVAPLVRRLTPPPQSPQFQHVGVVGHRGVGKTTSVRKAMGSLETPWLPLPVLERLGGRDLVGGLAIAASALVIRGEVADLAVARSYLERAVALADSMGVPFSEKLRQWLASDAGRA